MLDLLKKTIFIGAGLASMTAEKIEEAVAEIVKKGELSEKQGRELVKDLLDKSSKARKDLNERIENTIQDALQKLKIPWSSAPLSLPWWVSNRSKSSWARAAAWTLSPTGWRG